MIKPDIATTSRCSEQPGDSCILGVDVERVPAVCVGTHTRISLSRARIIHSEDARQHCLTIKMQRGLREAPSAHPKRPQRLALGFTQPLAQGGRSSKAGGRGHRAACPSKRFGPGFLGQKLLQNNARDIAVRGCLAVAAHNIRFARTKITR